jgi:hypothetical protein
MKEACQGAANRRPSESGCCRLKAADRALPRRPGPSHGRHIRERERDRLTSRVVKPVGGHVSLQAARQKPGSVVAHLPVAPLALTLTSRSVTNTAAGPPATLIPFRALAHGIAEKLRCYV